MKKLLLLLAVLIVHSSLLLAQVTLQPWTQVYGSVPGQKLGNNVTGITPVANLPYKAAVSKIGSTGVYLLQTPSDTMIRQTFIGENLFTADLNNDEYADVVVTKTVNGWDTVYIYWGTMTGIDTLNPLRIPGENQNDFFGARCIGDVNNDGKPDLVASALGYPNLFSNGKVYVYLNPVTTPLANATLIGDSAFFGLGENCAVADINNDGYKDLIIKGNNQSGNQSNRYDYLNIYWGINNDTLYLKLGQRLTGYNLNSRGLACFDTNGDGISDLLWTQRDSAFVDNEIYVHYGKSNFDTVPSLKLKNPGVGDFGGKVIANAGDVNGDGYNDVLVSAADATDIAGFVFIFGGGPQIDDQFDAAVGLSQNSRFGWSASSVGDVNGDGLSDIIVGAPEYSFGDNKGYWGIFLGDTAIRVTDVKEVTEFPTVFKLYQCYPNPFNPNTSIRYDLKQEGFVTLEIFNSTGQKVAVLVSKRESVGTYEVSFNATQFATGTYFYKLTVKTNDEKTYSDTKKLTLIK